MQRVVVLGGGVGGTLAANLIARKLKERSPATTTVTVVDETGQHAYQPGYMYIAMGHERAEQPVRPGASLLERTSTSSSATSRGSTRCSSGHARLGRAPCTTTSW